MLSWASIDFITAPAQTLNGVVYSEIQLGFPYYSMKIKGCAWVHANVGPSLEKRIAMGYACNLNKINLAISLSLSATIGGSFSSGSGMVYIAALTIKLSY